MGLGSVFEDFSTYQGKTVGNDGGPSQTHSTPTPHVNEATKQPSNQFDFDFSASGPTTGAAAGGDSPGLPQTEGIDDLLNL